jgi:hypothetical protein
MTVTITSPRRPLTRWLAAGALLVTVLGASGCSAYDQLRAEPEAAPSTTVPTATPAPEPTSEPEPGASNPLDSGASPTPDADPNQPGSGGADTSTDGAPADQGADQGADPGSDPGAAGATPAGATPLNLSARHANLTTCG